MGTKFHHNILLPLSECKCLLGGASTWCCTQENQDTKLENKIPTHQTRRVTLCWCLLQTVCSRGTRGTVHPPRGGVGGVSRSEGPGFVTHRKSQSVEDKGVNQRESEFVAPNLYHCGGETTPYWSRYSTVLSRVPTASLHLQQQQNYRARGTVRTGGATTRRMQQARGMVHWQLTHGQQQFTYRQTDTTIP